MNNAKENLGLVAKGVFKSILGIDFIGRTALEIHNEYQAKQVKRKIQRLEEFYQKLDEKLVEEENNVNEEFVKKDDFLDVFEEATRYIVLERLSTKRELFKNILANSIVSSDCDYDKTEHYFRILDNLSENELKVLAVLENPEEYNKNHGMIIKDLIKNYYQSSWGTYRADGVLTQLLGIKIDEAIETVTVLYSNGLIVDNLLERRLETNTNPVRVLDKLLTKRGRDFVKFLSLDELSGS